MSENYMDYTEEVDVKGIHFQLPLYSDIPDEQEIALEAENYVNACQPEHDTSNEWLVEDDLKTVLATNKALQEYLDKVIRRVADAISENRERQRRAIEKHHALRVAGNHMMKKIPVQRYLPPYFKDGDQMCAPHSEEGNRRMQMTGFDPLMREEKKWSAIDIRRLREAVKSNIIQMRTEELRARRDTLKEKLRQAGQDAKAVDLETWKEDLQVTMRKLEYENNRNDLDLLETPEAKQIDWEKINNIDFGGAGRRADAIRLKWINEVSPRWNQDPWSDIELQRLKQLREKRKFDSWVTLANKLGTNRTPWQCFQRYKTDLFKSRKEWTQEEDQRLLKLCSIMKNNDKILWGKVTAHMPGRKRQDVRVRYTRTLDKYMKHGPWTDQEDLLLISAVNRIGARDWSKIAKAIPCRTDIDCRERWVSAMDRRLLTREWSLDDDEKLIFLVSIFGFGQWEKCADNLVGRTPEHCRLRYQTIMTAKSRFFNARSKNISSDSANPGSITNIMKRARETKLYQQWKNSTDDHHNMISDL